MNVKSLNILLFEDFVPKERMSCIQNVLNPNVRLGTPLMGLSRTCSLSRVSFVQMPALRTIPTLTLQHHKIPSTVCSSSKNKTCAPTCLFGGLGNSRGDNKAFSFDSLKDFVKGFSQKKEAQDILRDQIKQREFGGDDGDGNPPRGRGGGGSDGNEDEGFAGILEEALQVFLATIGFILVYIYILRGPELIKLARDYIKYLFGGVPSLRLQSAMTKWRKTCSKFSYTDSCEDWLERAIVTTPTWWYSPEEVVQAVKKRRRRRDHRQN